MTTLLVLWLAALGGVPGAEAGARRDPFVRPGSPSAPDTVTCAAAGLGRVRARDVVLRGIVKHRERMLALLAGIDGRSYVARVDDRLCDARVAVIDLDGVSLVLDGDVALERAETRTIRLRLHGE